MGIDATKHRFVLLKSRMYCRPVVVPIAKALVECCGGVTGPDFSRFPFTKLSRPAYPFDEDAQWPESTTSLRTTSARLNGPQSHHDNENFTQNVP